MRPHFVVIILIFIQFISQIFGITKQYVIQEFLSAESDAPFYKWMGCRYTRDRILCEILIYTRNSFFSLTFRLPDCRQDIPDDRKDSILNSLFYDTRQVLYVMPGGVKTIMTENLVNIRTTIVWNFRTSGFAKVSCSND